MNLSILTLFLSSLSLIFVLFVFQGAMMSYTSKKNEAGGDEEDRTPYPLLARQVLSQMSYTPNSWSFNEPQKLNSDKSCIRIPDVSCSHPQFSLERR